MTLSNDVTDVTDGNEKNDLLRDVLIAELKNAPPELRSLALELERQSESLLQSHELQSIRAGINRFLFVYDDMKQDYSSLKALLSKLDGLLMIKN
uniref:hypothetical protein n=1 Tax=Pantoea sp. IMH TaxID=1267600 RepID=UPI00046A7152|nr:hypothetical protein [Pantoea sp. IMH]